MAQVDLDMVRGDDVAFDIVVTDVNGTVINLTGGTLRFTARGKSSDAAAVLEKTSVNSLEIEFTDAVHGMASLYIDAADTTALYAPAALVYDFEFEAANGKVSTVLPEGVLYIRRDITHA